MKIFPKEKVVGIFRGFSEGGLEFHADLTLPYRNEFQRSPMHGQFLIVQLETENEAVLGRITSMFSQGMLSSGAGEDFGLRAVKDERPIPEDLLEQYLKYRVNMRVLGVLRNNEDSIVFVPSHRRLPHVGSKVAFLSDEVLRELVGHNDVGAEIGFLAYGEFVFAGDDKRLVREPWMKVSYPEIIPKFKVESLVARRSFVFARAGFGKSNLVKLIFSNLYQETPMVKKRGERSVPVGTLIFDPDGEYFWPDDKNRPGLCDVPELENHIVVFTDKKGPSHLYQSFVASGIRLDIRRMRPSDVISIALSPEKQEQQNVRKLRGLNDRDWASLVDQIHINKNATDGNFLKEILKLTDNQEAEMVAARANMTTIVSMLHDPSSQMMDMLFESLRNGKICVVDVSQMRGNPALVLSGLILQKIFNHNQEEFTKAQPETIPTIAVIEEAQSVLGSSGSSGEGPYISWVKEGRKYDLGAVLITQQPGSITNEILSQGDNWFIFHLLSAGDLQAVKKANAHFSDDILSALLNEPIPGHGVFWSSAGGKSYPISIRVLSFENTYKVRDPEYKQGPLKTFAVKLKERYSSVLNKLSEEYTHTMRVAEPGDEYNSSDTSIDIYDLYKNQAVKTLLDNKIIEKVKTQGYHWKGVQSIIEKSMPDTIQDRNQLAFNIMPEILNIVLGDNAWDTEKRPSKTEPSKMVTYVIFKK